MDRSFDLASKLNLRLRQDGRSLQHMMVELQIPETAGKDVPRWVQLLAGLVRALLTVFCSFPRLGFCGHGSMSYILFRNLK